MSTARRVLWCVVLLTWPAVAGVRAAWSPSWGALLSDAGAAVTVALGLLLLRRGTPVPRLAERRTKRQIADLARRMSTVEAGLAETQAQRASGIEGIRRALDEAGVPVPDCVSADAPTQPVIRGIGSRRAV